MTHWIPGDYPLQARVSGRHRIFLMWGQSHMAGVGKVSELTRTDWPQDGNAHKDCWIWDKFGRSNWLGTATVDADRSNEAHAFKPLTVGWSVGDTYSWEEQAADPWVGPEQEFAHLMRQMTGDTILIVKFAISGTRVTMQAYPTWNVAQTGESAYIDTLKTAYWDEAKAAALTMAGDGDLVFGGCFSMIGFTDASADPAVSGYTTDYGNCIDEVRSHIDSGSPTDVPYCVIQTPRYADSEGAGLGFIDEIRAAQVSVAAARTGVDCIDGHGIIDRTTDIHASALGNRILGARMARWAYGVTPLAVTA